MPAIRPQRRSRRIAMSDEERDRFLTEQRTCRAATVTATGRPHVTPLWFVWDGSSIWLYSVVRSQRWKDLQADPRMAVVVDDGVEYVELHGVELSGAVEVVGPVPRTGAEDVPELTLPEELFFAKYFGGQAAHDGRHAWLRLQPDRQFTFDMRKLAGQ